MEPQQSTPQPPVQHSPPIPPKTSSHSLRTKLLIMLLGVLVIIGFVMYAYQKDIAYQNTTIEPTPVPSPMVDKATQWKTYSTEEYGFEFEYPGNYQIQEKENSIGIAENFDIEPYYSFYSYLTIKPFSNKYSSLEEYFTNHFCYEDKDPSTIIEEWPKRITEGCVKTFNDTRKELTVGGVDGLQGTFNPYEHGHIVTIFVRNNSMFEFHLANTQETGGFPTIEEQKLYTQILNSFRFVEEESVTQQDLPVIPILSTAGWKEASYEGIAFKIPPTGKCGSDTGESLNNCQYIYYDLNDRFPQTFSVEEYQGGSRREQFLKLAAHIDCRWQVQESKFGAITALQMAADQGWCQGGYSGGITTVVGNKFVVFWGLGYNLQTKIIDRFDKKDTLISTLRPL